MKPTHLFFIAAVLVGTLNAQQNEIITSVPINGALGLKFGMNHAQVEEAVRQVGWVRRDPPAGCEWVYADDILLKDVMLAGKHVAAEVNLIFLYGELSTISMNFSAYLYFDYKEINRSLALPDTEDYRKLSSLKGMLIEMLSTDLQSKYGDYNEVADEPDVWFDPIIEKPVPSVYWKDISGNTIELLTDESGGAGYLSVWYYFKKNHDRRERDEKEKINRDF